MSEPITPEQLNNPEANADAKILLETCKSVLKSSPEFTQEALTTMIVNGGNLQLSPEQTHTLPNGNTMVNTESLRDAAADSFFQGRYPMNFVWFRLGFDPMGTPLHDDQKKYQEIEASFPSAVSMHLKYRERDINDRSRESNQAPSWTELIVSNSTNKQEILYRDQEGSTHSKTAFDQGQALVSNIAAHISLPRS